MLFLLTTFIKLLLALEKKWAQILTLVRWKASSPPPTSSSQLQLVEVVPVNFHYCQMQEHSDELPLALVRFTAFDGNRKVTNVEQVAYQENRYEKMQFQMQVAAALQCGMDVSVLTNYPMEEFAELCAALDH